jgi:Uma2 family endonuclease
MVIHIPTIYTVEEFEAFIRLPENAGKDWELIGGRVVEVVANNYSSEIAAIMLVLLGGFVLPRKLGRLTGADGGYIINGERYIPDVAFISFARQPKASREAYNPNPPELAVEVLSPSNSESEMRIKLANYLLAGTLLWVIDPDKQHIEVYAPGEAPRTININGTLDGGTVLPGFTLNVADIFAQAQG